MKKNELVDPKVKGASHFLPGPVNTDDKAAPIELKDGDMVKVSSRRGSIEIPVQESDKVTKGNIFVPFHFAEACANVLTNDAVDPVSKIPELKVCSAKVEKI